MKRNMGNIRDGLKRSSDRMEVEDMMDAEVRSMAVNSILGQRRMGDGDERGFASQPRLLWQCTSARPRARTECLESWWEWECPR